MGAGKLLDGRLKFRHLILADVLTARGSVAGAAAALHVTQPAVTRGLQELERVLGVELYERGPRGVEANELGLAFTEYARAILAQVNQAERHLDEIRNATRGRVVIGTHVAGSNLLLPRTVSRLKRERRLLTIIVREGTPQFLLEELAAGRVDMILGRISGPTPEHTRRHALYEEEVRIIVRDGHPLTTRARIDLSDLLDHTWILPGAETTLRIELEEYFARHGHEFPVDSVEVTAHLTVLRLLMETDMVAALPGLVAFEPGLTALPLELDGVRTLVGVTVAEGRRLSHAATAMFVALGEEVESVEQPGFGLAAGASGASDGPTMTPR
jgi:DNA-binding transcriptional LysR family regulator